ncbi:MAG: hypothetical protein LAC69_08735 [Chlorobium sp.]|jgi:hypothetical protein|nr:hypothetical protein [Chlorobium sp.]
MDIKKKLLLVAIPLLVAGCGNQEQGPKISQSQEPPVAVESIAVLAVKDDGGEVLLVPAKAIFHKGELSGVFVVGADNRLTVRWISTGRSMNNDFVVLSGLDKEERVVGSYSPALHEGVTVIKSVTAEDQTNE